MDRFFRGLVAGMIGGIVMNLWSLFAYHILKLPVLRFQDWSGIFLFGKQPITASENLYALVIQILWVGLLGIILAFLIPRITSGGYLLKGAFFGLMTGFFVYAIPFLFKIEPLTSMSLVSILVSHFGGILWGMTTALVLDLLDRRTKVHS